MLVYSYILITVMMLGIISVIKKNMHIKNNINIQAAVVFIILFIVSGFRENVGTDFVMYQNYFDNISHYSIHKPFFDTGFYILNLLLSNITNDSGYIFLIFSGVTIGLINTTLKNYSKNYLMSIFLFITMYFYFTSMNIIRQYLGVAIFLYVVKYIYKRDLIKFLIFIIIGSLFHDTLLLMIPFYWILNMKFNKLFYFFCIIASFLLSFNTSFIIKLASKILPSLAYYADRIVEGASANGKILIVLSVFCFAIAKEKLLIKLDPKVNIYINALFWALIFLIFSNNNIEFSRFADYFYIYGTLLIPLVVVSFNKYLKVPITMGVALVFIFNQYKLLLSNNAGVQEYFFNSNFIKETNVLIEIIIIYILLEFLKAMKKKFNVRKFIHNSSKTKKFVNLTMKNTRKMYFIENKKDHY